VDERLQRASSHGLGFLGLPAENAAIKNNTPPRQWTLTNIASMKKQFKRLGFAYDWKREVTTCMPDYYVEPVVLPQDVRASLVYRKNSRVNWCPDCATVLANEQVVGRLLLASRDDPGYPERTRTVVHAHHQLLRRTFARPRQVERLARESSYHAAQLDWSK